MSRKGFWIDFGLNSRFGYLWVIQFSTETRVNWRKSRIASITASVIFIDDVSIKRWISESCEAGVDFRLSFSSSSRNSSLARIFAPASLFASNSSWSCFLLADQLAIIDKYYQQN